MRSINEIILQQLSHILSQSINVSKWFLYVRSSAQSATGCNGFTFTPSPVKSAYRNVAEVVTTAHFRPARRCNRMFVLLHSSGSARSIFKVLRTSMHETSCAVMLHLRLIGTSYLSPAKRLCWTSDSGARWTKLRRRPKT